MFEKIKNWLNPESKPPLWVHSIQGLLGSLDAQSKIQRDLIVSLENQQSLILKQIDKDALVVAKLSTQIQEMDHCLSEIVQFGREMREESTVQDATIVQLKVGDKVRVKEMSDLGEDFDGKTGRITSTKFSDTGTGFMLYTVRFPRKIQGSAINEFYNDELELVEE